MENEDITYPQGIDNPEENQPISRVDDNAKCLADNEGEIETPDEYVYHPNTLTPSTLASYSIY